MLTFNELDARKGNLSCIFRYTSQGTITCSYLVPNTLNVLKYLKPLGKVILLQMGTSNLLCVYWHRFISFTDPSRALKGKYTMPFSVCSPKMKTFILLGLA